MTIGTRPLYETAGDLSAEGEFIDGLCTLWKCGAWKLPIRYKLDYALFRGESIRAFLEIKVRNYRKDAFEDYMISMDKVLTARIYSDFAKVPSILAVQWLDTSGFIDLGTLKNFSLGFGGRTDREDSQDREPVVLIPISDFSCIDTVRNPRV
jgi:hypothetical protein